MKTRCPQCEIVFRITPEQLKARAGKVRCGHCQGVFNALDSLLENTDAAPVTTSPAKTTSPRQDSATVGLNTDGHESVPERLARLGTHEAPPQHQEPESVFSSAFPLTEPPPDLARSDSPVLDRFAPAPTQALPDVSAPEFRLDADDSNFPSSLVSTGPSEPDEPSAPSSPPTSPVTDPSLDILLSPPSGTHSSRLRHEPSVSLTAMDGDALLSPDEALELGRSSGLILPRETNEIPGYSRWADGAAAPLSLSEDAPARWPFVLIAIVLLLGLAGQAAFRFRSELSIALPAARPALAYFSRLFDADIPLPRKAQLISIEASDLQADPAHGNLLVLSATVRNRAAYGQAYPSLELSLTDTRDTAIARKVFLPPDYLPEKLANATEFPANTDMAVRLWIDAKGISAAGYRLYVFYP